ncbi:MAG TPA: branched-chain amino acid ABC transporter substrate-binding protein [Longimicrobiales bacterium]
MRRRACAGRVRGRASRWLVAPAAVLAACRPGDGVRSASGDSVFIAVAASLGSGSNKAYFDGVRLAVEHLNDDRPPDSPPLGVRIPRSATATQVEIAEGFRNDPAVIGVVGHTGSAQTLEAAPVYGDVQGGGRNAVLAISPGATNPVISGVSKWVFRDCPTDINMAAAMAAYTADTLGRRRVGLIYRNDLFGRGFARAFAAAFQRRNGVVVEHDPYLAGVTEYAAYARRMKQEGVQALIIAGGAADAGPMLRALRAQLGDIPVLGTDDMASIQADTGAAREFRGVHYAAFYLPETRSGAASARFVTEYRQRFGSDPDTRAALAYDAATIIGRAVRETGPDRARVRDWVASVGRGRPAHAGITGDIRFDERGDAVGKPVFITEVKP